MKCCSIRARAVATVFRLFLHQNCVLPLCLLFMGIACAQVHAQGSPLLDQFIAQCREWVPQRGSLLITCENQGSSAASRTSIGLDIESGAWFIAGGLYYSGQTPDGRSYAGETRSGKTEIFNQPLPNGVISVGDFVPASYLIRLRRLPQIITAIAQDSQSGEWTVTFVIEGQAGEQAREGTLVVSADGKPQQLSVPIPGEPVRTITFEYAAESDLPVPIASASSAAGNEDTRIVSSEFIENGNPRAFDISTVESIAHDNSLAEGMKIAAIAAQMRASKGTREAPYAGSWLSSSRWPLFAVGAIAVLVGLGAVWHARRAS